MTITLLIWARLLLVTDWHKTAVCDGVSNIRAVSGAGNLPHLGNLHAGGCA